MDHPVRVVVLVPRRSDGGRRDHVWAWVRDWWAREHPDWPVYEGHHDTGPFNRSAAINHANRLANPWDIAIIADSDSFVGPAQINTAVEGAYETGQMWLAYDRFMYLSRAMSDRIMDGYQGAWEPGVEWSMTGTCSSMVVVRKDVWALAGGFDEGFVGWGGDDIGASHAFQTFGGGLQRAPGPVWHLWHSPAIHAPTETWVPRAERYHAAAYDRDAMRALLVELGVTSDSQAAHS